MTTPFEEFHAKTWRDQIHAVEGEPGLFSDGGSLRDASWDRKAAYLLWTHIRAAPAQTITTPLIEDMLS